MMDPDSALAELLDALGQHDWDRSEECSESLLSWMERGGFPPVTIGPKALGIEWHRAIATFVCHAAQSKVNDARKRRRVSA